MWNIKPPANGYYAVIFSSTKSDDLDGYEEMDRLTMALAQKQEGFLGYESCNNDNRSIFISYWQSLEHINTWRHHMTHIQAKSNAEKWYKRYLSQICKVEQCHLYEKNMEI